MPTQPNVPVPERRPDESSLSRRTELSLFAASTRLRDADRFTRQHPLSDRALAGAMVLTMTGRQQGPRLPSGVQPVPPARWPLAPVVNKWTNRLATVRSALVP